MIEIMSKKKIHTIDHRAGKFEAKFYDKVNSYFHRSSLMIKGSWARRRGQHCSFSREGIHFFPDFFEFFCELGLCCFGVSGLCVGS